MSNSIQLSQRGTAVKLQGEFPTNVTKSDTTEYSPTPIFVGTAGNVTLMSADGSTSLFLNIANGTFMPVIATRIMSTGTTASDFVIFK